MASVIMFGIMAAVFAVILFNFRPSMMSDSLNLWDTALYFAKTGKWPIESSAPHASYFGRYSNNYFLVVCYTFFFRFLQKIGIRDVSLPLLLLAVAAIMAAVVFTWLIGMKIGGLRGAVKIQALCVLNPVYYILVLWIYTNVFSIPLTMAVIYFGICIYQEEREWRRNLYCILLAICSVAGYFIRPTIVIPLIAFIICGVLWAARSRKNAYRLLKCGGLCLLAGIVLFKAVSALNDSYFSTVSERNYPVTHWLMMAAHGNGTVRTEDNNYTGQFKTKEEKVKATTEKIKEYYSEYSLPEFVSFLYKKLVISWGHGDGGDLLGKLSQDKKMTRLYSWIFGDRSDLFQLYCYSFYLADLFLILIAIWSLLKEQSVNPYQFLFVLSFLGGILFYCLWEVKSSYTLPFVYIMLCIGMYGANVLAGKVALRSRQRKLMLERPAAYALLACMLCISLISYDKMVNTVVTRQDWSVRCAFTHSVGKYGIGDGELLNVSQEFYAPRPFNRLVLLGFADEEARVSGDSYIISLQKENGAEVYAGEIHAEELSEEGTVCLDVGEIIPDGREKYILKLSEKESNRGKMFFKRKTGKYMDIYDGSAVVNGKENNSDLCLQVYGEFQGEWCSGQLGILINGSLFAAAFLLYLCLQHDRKINEWIKRWCGCV
ncbi:MAG: hypothetical protein Q4C61_01185 [Lachnospiraceae bacterium]|nr:hypothetical protein [Lachnospiraceae bacterium]